MQSLSRILQVFEYLLVNREKRLDPAITKHEANTLASVFLICCAIGSLLGIPLGMGYALFNVVATALFALWVFLAKPISASEAVE